MANKHHTITYLEELYGQCSTIEELKECVVGLDSIVAEHHRTGKQLFELQQSLEKRLFDIEYKQIFGDQEVTPKKVMDLNLDELSPKFYSFLLQWFGKNTLCLRPCQTWNDGQIQLKFQFRKDKPFEEQYDEIGRFLQCIHPQSMNLSGLNYSNVKCILYSVPQLLVGEFEVTDRALCIEGEGYLLCTSGISDYKWSVEQTFDTLKESLGYIWTL